MSVHIDDHGFLAGGFNDGPEGILVDLDDLTDSGAYNVQTTAHCTGSLPTTGMKRFGAQARCWKTGEEDEVVNGGRRRRRAANGRRRGRQVERERHFSLKTCD